ncbi:MAG TPA: SDR family oxidoreductase [Solirubrobacteraceae bacterium]|nr:SDR family oxidoreductase [Solirubrobacteraceae bacterium]
MARGGSLAGQTVLITGAARGIGAATARLAAERGARLSLVGLEPEELERVAAECGPEAVWFEADITDSDALDAAVSGTVERFGGLDALLANAGIAVGGMVRSLPPGAFEKVVEVNLIGAYRTVRACLPALIERRGYSLTVASIAAAAHPPGMASYAASKAGVEAFNNALRQEIHHLGVEVGVAYFPWLETDLVSGAEEHPAFAFFRSQLTPPFNKTYPVEIAAQALARGLERRTKRVAAPGWVRGALLARGVLNQFAERDARKWGAELDRMYQQELEEQGEAAARPVGAGGEAAARATEPQRS